MCAITLCDVPVGGKQVQRILTQFFRTVPHVGCLPVTSSAKIHVSPSKILAANCWACLSPLVCLDTGCSNDT